MRTRLKVISLILFVCSSLSMQALRVMSYNVENLFDCERDSINPDSSFTPEGTYRWTYTRYHHKCELIARTIVNVGEWEGTGLVGLCEVESERCLNDLCRIHLRTLPYSFVHYDSPDSRGIDVALLYRTDLFRVLSSAPLPVPTPSGARPTRDILYVEGISIADNDTLHLFVCHLPSQLGGKTAVLRRQQVKQILQQHCDSLLFSHPQAKIIVMGDMNSAPKDDLSGMVNMMLPIEQQGLGSYKYKGSWSCIDQFYVSSSVATARVSIYDAAWLLTEDEAFVGYKPRRTYTGMRYDFDGYSDHLPIVLNLPSATTMNVLPQASIEDIIEDIYSQLNEDMGGETADFESLADHLQQLMNEPIALNNTSLEELLLLPQLSEAESVEILLKQSEVPLKSVYELQLVPGLKDYEIRNLLPFVCVGASAPQPFYWRELWAKAHHDLSLRADVRNAEGFEGTDPVYVQGKYSYSYRRQVQAGLTLRRPAGGQAEDLQYGGYVQVDKVGVVDRAVGGCYEAQFGQGLVTNAFFHTGKSSRVMEMGALREGLRRVSSAGSDRYQGVGATVRLGKQTKLTAWYSVDDDKVWHHALGVNMTVNLNRLRIGLTLMEHLYSDSLKINTTYYNTHYFRGKSQFVGGVNWRYGFRWLYLFGEAAVAQNKEWGGAGLLGVRLTPVTDLGLVALYRYYSLNFDNAYGFAFSETSRLGDEQGGYIGVEYKGWKNWRLAAYGDVFHFQDAKFGIREKQTTGYEVRTRAEYLTNGYQWLGQVKCRRKGADDLYAFRTDFSISWYDWRFRTRVDANYLSPAYGLCIAQDAEYRFRTIPLVLQLRLEGFDVRQWNNRIYAYENDVLYAFSIPAVYGLGGRWYINARARLSDRWSVYFMVSQTVFQKEWATAHLRAQTRTDVHLLVRCKLPAY